MYTKIISSDDLYSSGSLEIPVAGIDVPFPQQVSLKDYNVSMLIHEEFSFIADMSGYLVNYRDIVDLKNKLSILLLKKFNDKDLKNSIKKNQIKYAFKHYEKIISLFI